MSAAPAMPLAAIVTNGERPGIIAAGEQLAQSLTAASGVDWQVRLRFASHQDGDIPPDATIVASLQEDAANDEPVDRVRQRWHGRIAGHRAAGHDRILLCNLFRHVDASSSGVTIERIRRLNRLAIELSHDLGIEIVDVDRLLALCGARTIGADYRCGSTGAARLVGHAIVAALLDGDLSGRFDAAAQERARTAHGGVRDIGRLIERHIRARPA